MVKKVRVADYIVKFVEERLGVDKVFLLVGGGNMHLTDAVLKNKNMSYICNHHEQACAMAAVGYAKQTGKPGVVMPSTGCGGTNTITGLLDAWQDSLPCVFISGQVNTMQTTLKSSAKLRKFGVQEANIIEIVKPLTKYAVMVDDAEDIRFHLEKAACLARDGRPGPVWLDIPLDVQGKFVDEEALHSYLWPDPDSPTFEEGPQHTLGEAIDSSVDLDFLKKAKRPIILAGNGIKLGYAEEEFKEMVRTLRIPVVTTYLGIDILNGFDPLFVGRVGVKGDRAGNFALQNADLILAIGTSLSVAVTGYNYAHFGREAKLVVVDIDPEEHSKDTVKIDKLFNCDVKYFAQEVLSEYGNNFIGPSDWVEQCAEWKDIWKLDPIVDDSDVVDLYHFTKCLSDKLPSEASVVGDAGSAYYVPSQMLHLKRNQKWITPGAQAEMGFTLPAVIGVQVGSPDCTVVGITGDGSFQFNVQELQTIRHYNLPIKLFVWNNDGYLSIRNTQEKFFDGDYIGTNRESGVSLPDISKIASAYNIHYEKIETNGDCAEGIQRCIDFDGPVVCEVMCDDEQKVLPTLSSQKKEDGSIIGRPLEDMDPLLPRGEFYKHMKITPIL